ncbi:MAG: enolase C-terminal domain-like protein, partial [Pseudomonadota bacterium]
IGLDPRKTDFIWTKLYRDLNWVGPNGVSLCAISGIDMALLDLKAKMLGVPCYDLLGGGYRKEIRLYANYWFIKGGHNPEDYAESARKVKAAGFTGLKFDPFAHTSYLYGEHLSENLSLSKETQDLAYDISKAVRDAVGDDFDIMIETHALLNLRMAVKMAQRLADLDITWYEEPVGPENIDSLVAVRQRMPGNATLCVGERHYTRYGIRQVLERQICEIMMPDITRCGGPSEMKRMATMMEAYNVLLAPHNPNGPLSGLAVYAYETDVSTVRYREFEKFKSFVEHKDFGGALDAHAERGLSTDNFVETYSRHVKSLVAIGSGRGADLEIGLATEIIALDNPYTDDLSNGMRVQVNYRGEPRPDVQVEIYKRPAGEGNLSSNVTVDTVRTDETGMAVIPIVAGHDYMLDAVVLREPPAERAAINEAVWDTLWANLTFSVPLNPIR